MANSFKNNGKTITYTIQTTNKVTYSDGRSLILPTSSVALSAVQKAYLAAIATPPVVTPPSPPVIINKPPAGTPILIGNKELAVLSDVENQSFILKPGIYTDRSDWKNLRNVSVDGQSGVQFKTVMRAIQMNGNVSGVSLMNMFFQDINDAVIDFWGNGAVKYVPGTDGTFVDGFTLKNVYADNCGTLFHADGTITNGVQYGLVKNLVIDSCSFKNSPEPRSVIFLGNGMDYSISNFVIDHINYVSSVPGAPYGAHNGILQLGGNGKVFNNKFTNHEGNAVRAHLHSQQGTQMVEIFNNLVWNSTKYGAFEIQATPDMMANKYNPANARIYNNTAGHLNTSGEFEGQMVDVYPTGGTFEYYNNVGFEMNRAKGAITDMLNSMASMAETNIIKNINNRYFETAALAVVDTTSLKSLVPGAGAQF